MRKSSIRPYSTASSRSSIFDGRASRKISSAFGGSGSSLSSSLSSGPRKSSVIDDGKLEGKVKVSSTIKTDDLCLSACYREDGRYYATALANGVVNVYTSKTDNILYALNTEESHPFSEVSATCVRFRPTKQEPASIGRRDRRRSSLSCGSSDSGHFLPPIIPSRRRKSSVSALGIKLEEMNISEKSTTNNLVTASFTDGSLKTFNFLTGECLNQAQESREILTINYNCSGNTVATGGSDGRIILYDDETKKETSFYKPPFEYKAELLRTYSIAFHPESENEFVSGGWNRYIQCYDSRVPNLLVGKVTGPKITGEGLSFHPTGKEFCAASWGKCEGVEFFDYAMRKSIDNFSNSRSRKGSIFDSSKSTVPTRKIQSTPPNFLYAARYFMDNLIAIGGSYKGGLTILERNSGNIVSGIHDLKKSVYCLDTFNSKVVFIAGKEVCVAEIFL